MELKAIETVYNGYKFRSRLEARWAVFFDTLKIKWQYEFEGFDLGEAGYYLPDFYLTEWRIYIEIKPAINLITDSDKLKINTMRKMIDDLWQSKTDEKLQTLKTLEELDTLPRYIILLVETPDVPWQEGEGSRSVQKLLDELDMNWKRNSILVSEAVKAARQARF